MKKIYLLFLLLSFAVPAFALSEMSIPTPTPTSIPLTIIKHSKVLKITGTEKDEALGVAVLKDGNLFFTGTTNDAQNGFDQVLAMKTTREGKIIWKKMFGGKYESRAVSAVETNDGCLAMTGTSENQAFILELDRNGNFLWEKKIDKGYIRGDGLDIRTEGDNVLVLLELGTGDNYFGATMIPGLVVLDKNGVIVKMCTYSGDVSITPKCFCSIGSEGYAIVYETRDVYGIIRLGPDMLKTWSKIFDYGDGKMFDKPKKDMVDYTLNEAYRFDKAIPISGIVYSPAEGLVICAYDYYLTRTILYSIDPETGEHPEGGLNAQLTYNAENIFEQGGGYMLQGSTSPIDGSAGYTTFVKLDEKFTVKKGICYREHESIHGYKTAAFADGDDVLLSYQNGKITFSSIK